MDVTSGGGIRGDEGGELAGEVDAQPRGGLGGDPLDRDIDDLVGVPVANFGEAALGGRELRGVESGRVGAVVPVAAQRVGWSAVLFRWSTRQHSLAGEVGDHPAIGLGTVVVVHPTGHQLGELLVDLLRARGEHPTQTLGHTRHIGLPVADSEGFPCGAETSGQLGAQRGVVDPADGALLLSQKPRVERQPLAASVLNLGGDHRVGVELRIRGAAGVLTEHRRGHPLRVDLVDAVTTATGQRAVSFEPSHGGFDRGVVRRSDLGSHPRILRQRPQHRDRLGCGERRVEAADSALAEAAAQRPAAGRMPCGEHRGELLRAHLPVEVERVAPCSPPAPRRLVRIQVVVHRTTPGALAGPLIVGEVRVVGEQAADPTAAGGLQRGHPQHETVPASGNAIVCRA